MTDYDDLFDKTAPGENVFADNRALDPLAEPEEIVARKAQQAQLARLLNGSTRGISRRRCRSKGPTYYHLGRPRGDGHLSPGTGIAIPSLDGGVRFSSVAGLDVSSNDIQDPSSRSSSRRRASRLSTTTLLRMTSRESDGRRLEWIQTAQAGDTKIVESTNRWSGESPCLEPPFVDFLDE